ncbi:hypothetical protein [Streptomyces rimosus]|uniref:hypothetical protein n=1 Tax=Streptomyces rimosus TaxID=1927 RepID=UPI000A6B84AB|nr:hypothetical protein [Streptomyces rimosus]
MQLIEEVSLLAADKRRTEPRTIPRPQLFGTTSAKGVPTVNTPAQQPAPLNGHRAMLAAAARRGMVRPDV